MITPGNKVYVVLISNRHGTHTYAHATLEGAEDAATELMREDLIRWGVTIPPHATTYGLVSELWDRHAGDEDELEIEEQEVLQ